MPETVMVGGFPGAVSTMYPSWWNGWNGSTVKIVNGILVDGRGNPIVLP